MTVIFLGLLKNEILRDISDLISSKLKRLLKRLANILMYFHKRGGKFIERGEEIKSDIYLFLIAPILLLLLFVMVLPIRLLKILSILFAPHNTTIKVLMILGIIITFAGLMMELIAYW